MAPLTIDDPEAVELANSIARQTGQPIQQVVVDALRDEYKRVAPRKVPSRNWDELDKILQEVREMPDLDPRSSKELFDDLYDENGLIK